MAFKNKKKNEINRNNLSVCFLHQFIDFTCFIVMLMAIVKSYDIKSTVDTSWTWPINDFQETNRLDNLESLCCSCHTRCCTHIPPFSPSQLIVTVNICFCFFFYFDCFSISLPLPLSLYTDVLIKSIVVNKTKHIK